MPHRTPLHDAISEAADPLDLMNRIVAQAVLLVPGADGSSFEVKRDEETLEYVCAAGSLGDFVGLRLPVHASLSGLALLTAGITRTDDALDDPRVNREAVERTGVRSMLCVPVRAHGRGASVLKVSSRQPSAFTDDDVATLERLASFMDATVGAASEIARVTANLLEEAPGAPTNGGPSASDVARFIANVMTPGLLEGVESSQRIEDVIASEAIDIVVQPIVRLDTGELVAVEALARFPGTPQRAPDEWFAEARRSGRGVDLELMAVRSALRLLERLPDHVHLAVNLGPETLLSPRLDDALADVDPRRITIELTEHQRFPDYAVLIERTADLRSAGSLLSIDDTGAGYSGLTHILRLRPDVVKIDRDLTAGVEEDLVRQALVTALVNFAAGFGASVVAEGVESQEALDLLVSLGVRYGQGYHLGRPAPVEVLF